MPTRLFPAAPSARNARIVGLSVLLLLVSVRPSSPAAGDETGYSVAAAGDVNGDGLSDYLVGSPTANSGAGRVDVYLGSASGPPVLQRTLTSGEPGSHFGFSVSSAGDVNGDGYDDILVGMPDHNAGGGSIVGSGGWFIYYGGPSGIDPLNAVEFEAIVAGEHAGWSVSRIGNFNGDAYDDVAIGEPNYSSVFVPSNAGRVDVFVGSASGIVPSVFLGINGRLANEHLGLSIAGPGDMDADGFDDLVAGAPFIPGSAQAGLVYVYRGGTGPMNGAPADSVSAGAAGDNFGFSVAPAGDFDGDGYADVVVGAPYASNFPGSVIGRAYIARGDATGFAPLAGNALIANGSRNGARLGYSVGCAGDFNGDGFGDVVVGQPNSDEGLGPNQGRAVLVFGRHLGNGNLPDRTFIGPEAGGMFGSAVNGLGDLDGDGFGEIALSAPFTAAGGSVQLVNGTVAMGAAPVTVSWSLVQPSAFNGASVAAGGDLNGDGFDDFVFGAPGYASGGTGAALAVYGASSSTLTGTDTNLSSVPGDAQFGASVAIAGDVNGDGYDDVVIGGGNAGFTSQGQVRVYLGGPTGLATSPAWTLTGPTGFGATVAAAGDLNRDGYADIAIATVVDATHGANAGRVDVYFGGPNGPRAPISFFGSAANESLGVAIAPAGDVNGDGYDDLAIGAPGWSNDQGRILIVYGHGFTTASLPGDTGPHAGFGTSLAGRGDVDGDGYADLAIGVPQGLPGLLWGLVEIRRGGPSGLESSPSQALIGANTGDRFGASVSWGDLSGDGLSDLAVGIPGWDGTTTDQGATEVYLSDHGALTFSTRIAPTSTATGRGTVVAANSDLNGDGFADLVVGAPFSTVSGVGPNCGRVDLAAGGGHLTVRDRIERTQVTDDNFNTHPVALEDEALGFSLLLRARTAAGRQNISVQHQIGPVNLAYSILPTLSTPYIPMSAPDPSLGEYRDVGKSVGAAPGVPTKWRMRVRTRNPFFPDTPWLTPSGTAATLIHVFGTPATTAVGGESAPTPNALAASPNPVRSAERVTFSFTLERPSDATLAIYDVEGRRVRELARGAQPAGARQLAWDGRDESGRAVQAGVYFARLKTAEHELVRSFVRLP